MLAFVLGLAATSAALHVLARSNPSDTGGLLEHVAAHRGDYDVVVIGPSFTRLHFMPQVFEKRMRKLHHPLRAFGFGLKGLRGGELDYYIERVLALDMPRLKWLLVDVTLDQVRGIDRANMYKRRVVLWHGWGQLRLLHEAFVAEGGDEWTRLQRLEPHFAHYALNLGNVGEGVELLRSGAWLGATQRIKPRGAFSPRRGDPARHRAGGERFAHRTPQWGAWQRRLAAGLDRGVHPARDNTPMLLWRERARARGVQIAFILSPVIDDRHFPTAVPGDQPLAVLDFNDPRAYPELYDPLLRHDSSHMTPLGAELFSLDLAAAFAAMLDAGATGASASR